MTGKLKFALTLEANGVFDGAPDRLRTELTEEEYDDMVDWIVQRVTNGITDLRGNLIGNHGGK